jgi:hypothetical protein
MMIVEAEPSISPRHSKLNRLHEFGTRTSAGASKEVLLPAPTRVHRAPTFCTGPHEVVTRMCEWRLSGISTLAQPLRARVQVITKEGRSMVVDRRLR